MDTDNFKIMLDLYAIIKPIEIKVIGASFIVDERMVGLVIGNNHKIALPAIIDINERRIIGLIIGKCSLIFINGEDRLGAHKTTMVNRIE